jgi:Ca2+-dependent lipid-binding protein
MAWFNKVVDYMWPHVDTAVCEAVRAAVEPLMRTAAPPLVSWVGFEKITLGPTPPTLGGVKVHGSNSEEAMIEIEFSWAGGLDVVVAAYVFGVRLPVRIHDLQFRSYIRVTFTPLVDVLPCLGGLEVSLMGLPEHVDFGLTIPPGVDLMALPGGIPPRPPATPPPRRPAAPTAPTSES